jgi:hypothetical protein
MDSAQCKIKKHRWYKTFFILIQLVISFTFSRKTLDKYANVY